ncbi:phage baseplate plug family protein [Burkholderia cepacia]|uniref:phage baseplate plug family protein n=1 Tax=Burkholderia cepacia TaxID=292 RepID=UPI003D66FD85
MTTFYEIPLTPDPQTFTVTLSGVIYRLTVQYRAAGGTGWILDVADANGNPMVNGIPLVTGTDLLGQYAYLGFGGRLWVQGAASPDDVPTFDDLGVGSHLFWVTD